MKFLKKYKIIIIIIITFLVLGLFVILGMKELLYPDDRKSLYGRRLEGISEYNVDLLKLKKEIETIEGITQVDININGRIINISVSCKEEVQDDLGQIILKTLTNEEQSYFDIQLIVEKETDEKNDLNFGYKHKTEQDFRWSVVE